MGKNKYMKLFFQLITFICVRMGGDIHVDVRGQFVIGGPFLYLYELWD